MPNKKKSTHLVSIITRYLWEKSKPKCLLLVCNRCVFFQFLTSLMISRGFVFRFGESKSLGVDLCKSDGILSFGWLKPIAKNCLSVFRWYKLKYFLKFTQSNSEWVKILIFFICFLLHPQNFNLVLFLYFFWSLLFGSFNCSTLNIITTSRFQPLIFWC